MPGGHGERISPRIGTSLGVHAARAALSSSTESAKGAAATAEAAAAAAPPAAASPAAAPDMEAFPAANCAASARYSDAAACCSASRFLSCASSAVRGDRSLAGPAARGFRGAVSASPGLPSSSSTNRMAQVADKTASAVVDDIRTRNFCWRS